jgi:hypothetical protein
MNKARLWRVDVTNILGYQAPSFWIETETHVNLTREKAEQEALKLAKEQTGLGRFPKTWRITVTHLENYFQLNGRWVRQGVYKLNEKGQWSKNR